MGNPPGQILLSLRMHKATNLLRQGHAVAEVADACGYQSVAAFTRAFDKLVGMPPGAYRRDLKR
ncbi:HTH-type transcriptional regulator YdeO [compost metagenome]